MHSSPGNGPLPGVCRRLPGPLLRKNVGMTLGQCSKRGSRFWSLFGWGSFARFTLRGDALSRHKHTGAQWVQRPPCPVHSGGQLTCVAEGDAMCRVQKPSPHLGRHLPQGGSWLWFVAKAFGWSLSAASLVPEHLHSDVDGLLK